MIKEKVRFDWRQHPEMEIVNKRSHEEKHFQIPGTDQIIMIKSSGVLHAKTDRGFEDIQTEIPDFNFPEGKEISKNDVKHHMLDLPSWGRAELEDNNKVVRVYDLDNRPIYKYQSPLITDKGEIPYDIKDEKMVKVREGLEKDVKFGESLVRKATAEEAEFEVVDNKLYFKLSKTASNKLKSGKILQAWDATDITSVNNKDAFIRKFDATVNRGTLTDLHVYNRNDNSDIRRSIINFTLPSGSGSISDVNLYLYGFSGSLLGGPWDVNVHNLTQTSWTEAGNSWNNYSAGNAWTTPGGDFSATIIDTLVGVGNRAAWANFGIMGGAALNPLTLDWTDELNLLLKVGSETGRVGNLLEENYYSKEYAVNTALRPYLEITYSAGGAAQVARRGAVMMM